MNRDICNQACGGYIAEQRCFAVKIVCKVGSVEPVL
jgi:hypothetical protein